MQPLSGLNSWASCLLSILHSVAAQMKKKSAARMKMFFRYLLRQGHVNSCEGNKDVRVNRQPTPGKNNAKGEQGKSAPNKDLPGPLGA